MDPIIAKHANRRVPRYTSYPTAPHFAPDFPEATWREWLGATPLDAPLSLYLHVPFCKKVCWYCGCNMKLAAREQPVRDYAGVLATEVDLLAGAMPGRMQVGHVHWGGGTPTAMPADCMAAVMTRLREAFAVRPDAEIAVEIDPRTLEDSMAAALGEMGFTRASLGVQEFDADVQKTINRVQPYETVRRAVENLRAAGVNAINFDLMYGLPRQTVESLAATVERAVDLRPSRIALFGYAHVPWMAKNQRMIPEDTLPDLEARFEQADEAAKILVSHGYERLGLDHFALPSDPLTRAAHTGRMRRNFQGYTDDQSEHLLGLGATSISQTPQGYAQNIVETGAWARAVKAGQLPVHRGRALIGDDRLRRDVIERIMCDMEVDLPAQAFAHGETPDYFATEMEALKPFVEDGLVEMRQGRVRVADRGRPALRAIAAAFDAYLAQGGGGARHAIAV
ncbi:MAG: oxygen-independent coproporphyrinogen III oxidase [Rubrimonas sp.]|uniref:oxygen-independent coproporphyrinogen III oxidase n=1 Tax=Rubrimonas sp. TaxID=2036015 RepID=UPI002FDDB8E2